MFQYFESCKIEILFITAVFSFSSAFVDAQVLEEILVTAQKREENLQDVGISITAFTGDQLKNLGITNTVDITQQVPALQLNTFAPSLTILNLRGISQNNFQDNLEAPVAVYIDGAYVASMNAISGALFDVKRVEVLRGPQGTLFGRNTTGGLVHYITRGAEEDELNGYLEATAGEFDQFAFEGAIGGAINDNVRVRFAGRWEERDGYLEALMPGVADGNAFDGFTIRGSLQVDFSDSFLADLRVTYAEDNDVDAGTFSVDINSADPVTGLGIDAPPLGLPDRLNDEDSHSSFIGSVLNRDSTNTVLTLTWDVNDSLELVSITSYLDLDKYREEDGSGGFLELILELPPAAHYVSGADFESFTQEIRLSGESNAMRWQTGFYYLDFSLDSTQLLEGHPFFFPDPVLMTFFDTTQLATANLDSKNWSVFGQVEYDFSEHWTFIAGLRWSDDNKDLDYNALQQTPSFGVAPFEVFNIDNLGIPGIGEVNYEDYALRLQLNYVTESGNLFYGSINRGIKGGNWSIDPTGALAATDPASLRHDEEVLWSYEIGVKADLNDWARMNASIYYYDYDDYQTFSLVGLIPQVGNSDAKSHGGELELTMTPLEGLDFLFGIAYIDSEIDTVNAPLSTVTNTEFPNAPRWNFNMLARYEWEAFAGGRMAVQIDGVWYDDYFLETSNAEVSREDDYSVWNARVNYTTRDEAWKFSVWVKNFTDTTYRLYNLDIPIIPGFFSFGQEAYAPPRWFGGTITYNFGGL